MIVRKKVIPWELEFKAEGGDSDNVRLPGKLWQS